MLWVVVGLIVVGIIISAINSGGGPGPTQRGGGDDSEPNGNLVGRFIRWEPVDEARGYAYFEITNRGTSTATAECTIEVRNDFGNFGFDILVGERVPAGETISGRIPINVGEGSFLIDEGEVSDC